MGRTFPQDYHHHHYSTFPLLSLSLFILSIATTLSIVTALCGFLSRKEEDEVGVAKDDNNGEKNENGENLTSPRGNNSDDEASEGGEAAAAGQSENQPPLPPPQSMRAASFHYRSSPQASPAAHKKLVASLSMKVPGLGSRQMSKKKDDIFAGGCSGGGERKHKKLKHEDSVWKKTIILGEKCRVRDDSEEEAVYDEKGNRVTAYHPKPSSTTAALPMSRQSSAIDENGTRFQDDQKVPKMDEGNKGI